MIRFAFIMCILCCQSICCFAQTKQPAPIKPHVAQPAPANTFTEKKKIEMLIQMVQENIATQFYRNGTWYSGKTAAEHLQLKLGKAGSSIKTAHDFIEKLATSSSMTGEAYKIKLPNGTILLSKVYFESKLIEIEGKKPAN